MSYNIFRESAGKRGLLLCDSNLIECMTKVVSYQMPYILRHLFTTLLVYYNPPNPKKKTMRIIWKPKVR